MMRRLIATIDDIIDRMGIPKVDIFGLGRDRAAVMKDRFTKTFLCQYTYINVVIYRHMSGRK